MTHKALSTDLQEKTSRLQALSGELSRSMTVQDLWPDAFSTNQPVRLKGILRMKPHTCDMAFTKAWLECRDGRKYPLRISELKILKPDALIHPDYRE